MTQVLASHAPPRAQSKCSSVSGGSSTTGRGPRLLDDGMAVAAIELDVTDLLQVTAWLTREPDEREEPVRLLGLIRLVSVNRAALGGVP